MPVKTEEQELKETEVLFPENNIVVIDGEKVEVKQFKLGKTLLMLEMISELLEETDIAALVVNGDSGAVVQGLLSELPNIIKHGRPILLRAMALTLTPDKEVAELDNSGEDIRLVMDKKGRIFAADMDIEQAVDVVALGIKAMGIETLRKNLPKLMMALGMNQQTPGTP